MRMNEVEQFYNSKCNNYKKSVQPSHQPTKNSWTKSNNCNNNVNISNNNIKNNKK